MTLTFEKKDRSPSSFRTEERIKMLELPLPERPIKDEESPVWPRSVSDLSPMQLAEHLTWWSGWASYARYYLGCAETDLAHFELTYETDFDLKIYELKKNYKTVTEAKAAVRSLDGLKSAKRKIIEAKALVVSLRSLLSGYEEKYATVSREISRRGIDYEHTHRQERTIRHGR